MPNLHMVRNRPHIESPNTAPINGEKYARLVVAEYNETDVELENCNPRVKYNTRMPRKPKYATRSAVSVINIVRTNGFVNTRCDFFSKSLSLPMLMSSFLLRKEKDC